MQSKIKLSTSCSQFTKVCLYPLDFLTTLSFFHLTEHHVFIESAQLNDCKIMLCRFMGYKQNTVSTAIRFLIKFLSLQQAQKYRGVLKCAAI